VGSKLGDKWNALKQQEGVVHKPIKKDKVHI
jgi:hypothetical protein